MTKYTPTCIKCNTKYESNDPDPYYCNECEAEKKRIAAEIDARIRAEGPKPSQPSAIQILESGGTVAGPHGSKLFSRKVKGYD